MKKIYSRVMQIWDFLHKNCITTRQEFVRPGLQIRSFGEVKVFKIDVA